MGVHFIEGLFFSVKYFRCHKTSFSMNGHFSARGLWPFSWKDVNIATNDSNSAFLNYDCSWNIIYLSSFFINAKIRGTDWSSFDVIVVVDIDVDVLFPPILKPWKKIEPFWWWLFVFQCAHGCACLRVCEGVWVHLWVWVCVCMCVGERGRERIVLSEVKYAEEWKIFIGS